MDEYEVKQFFFHALCFLKFPVDLIIFIFGIKIASPETRMKIDFHGFHLLIGRICHLMKNSPHRLLSIAFYHLHLCLISKNCNFLFFI